MSRIFKRRVRKTKTTAGEPALLRCDCGETVALYSSWANECPECKVEYNGSGQRLAPREQWGHETGETAADLAFLDAPDVSDYDFYEGD